MTDLKIASLEDHLKKNNLRRRMRLESLIESFIELFDNDIINLGCFEAMIDNLSTAYGATFTGAE